MMPNMLIEDNDLKIKKIKSYGFCDFAHEEGWIQIEYPSSLPMIADDPLAKMDRYRYDSEKKEIIVVDKDIQPFKDSKKAERKEHYKQLMIEELFKKSPLLNDYQKDIADIDNLDSVEEIKNYKKD